MSKASFGGDAIGDDGIQAFTGAKCQILKGYCFIRGNGLDMIKRESDRR
ncbi:hypothetical protein PCO85_06845 [Prodigiosinella aquatilis]|nr:hypothetical protein [Prodigiosinella sp. LS101]WJV55128.1 hypothetical protein PCO85_06845 [Prodigiosinella sp. LS101]WJV59488.1 hypothetical protein PCO84_06850 [Pectobacteriaceae bacterium C111]